MAEKTTGQDNLDAMSLGDHLDELRSRAIRALLGLIPAVIITTIFGRQLFRFFCGPYEIAMRSVGREPRLITVGVAESFLMYCYVTLLFGLLLASPWIFWQLWQFIAAGLYAKEKRYVRILAPLSTVFFIGGAVFFIVVVAPLTLRFFLGFNVGVDFVENLSTLRNYLVFMGRMSLVFGLSFQLPLLMVGLNRFGMLSLEMMRRWRKYAILGIAIVSAVLTPPDVVSQISLGIPLYLLFELGVLICRIAGRKG
ncbi:MAG TPA: twin-arginine translocase subunit TatC [Sedimentisphaerales bacterium]|nr:twin-arginine translocase subunit TatC [Sedimentisphaerales bacterium]